MSAANFNALERAIILFFLVIGCSCFVFVVEICSNNLLNTEETYSVDSVYYEYQMT